MRVNAAEGITSNQPLIADCRPLMLGRAPSTWWNLRALQLLYHAKTEREAEIQPHGMSDNLGREPIPGWPHLPRPLLSVAGFSVVSFEPLELRHHYAARRDQYIPVRGRVGGQPEHFTETRARDFLLAGVF